ncbi:MAG: SGNH/GDSL hydrolase family protein [Longimicrobiales bacterium]
MTAGSSNDKRAALEERVRAIPFRRKVAFVLSIWITLFLIAEIGARVGGYFIYGRSPFFLFYGFKSFMADSDPEGHSAAYDGYFKFPPNRTLRQYGLFQEPTPIRINSHGFRGPEFEATKPASMIRIICLGESSTFGFFNSDTGTYPAILGRLMSDSARGNTAPRYEVINAGIPHANSDNIRAMVEHEILTYKPDVLTLYAGYNDAAALMAPSTLHKTLTWLHSHFASWVAFKRLITALGGPDLPSRWSAQRAGSDSAQVGLQARLHRERYRSNLQSMVSAVQGQGIPIVFIKQAVTTGWGDSTGLSYQQKVSNAQQTLARGERISGSETMMVVHSALMAVLDSVAAAAQVPVVNFIEVVNRHPEFFASYVHLTETGNTALAQALIPVLEREASKRQ